MHAERHKYHKQPLSRCLEPVRQAKSGQMRLLQTKQMLGHAVFAEYVITFVSLFFLFSGLISLVELYSFFHFLGPFVPFHMIVAFDRRACTDDG